MSSEQTFMKITNRMIYEEILTVKNCIQKNKRRLSVLSAIMTLGFSIAGAALYILFTR